MEIKGSAQRILNLLKKVGLDIEMDDITVHNIVMMGLLRMNASLEKILFSLDSIKASYEPEQFPGLIYEEYGASFLLFPSGKFIITGIRDIRIAEDAAENFRQVIEFIQ